MQLMYVSLDSSYYCDESGENYKLPEIPCYYDDGIKFHVFKSPGDCTVFASYKNDCMAIGRGKNLKEAKMKALKILFELE